MTFRFFSELKGFQKFAILITSALVIAVSIYIVLFNMLPFDGAFNTQAAINLYQKGILTLNYRPNISLQTLLPFQVVNGFFLTLFGNTFLATNLANILFYLLLFGLFVFLSTAYRSLLPLLAFSVFSLTQAFIFAFGFGGFGEIPALTFGLIGASFLIFKRESYWANIISGILIACSITTKWVLFLIMPPVFLTLFLLKLDHKRLIVFLAATISTFTIVSFIQFSHLEPGEMEKLFQSIVKQNTPHYNSEYSPKKVHNLKTYGLRLKKTWEAYSSMSFSFFAPVRIGFAVIIFLLAIYMLIRHRKRMKSLEIFFIFLAFFLFIYLFWGFTLNSRWPVRRMLNTDVLLYLGISLLPWAVRFDRIGRLATFGFLAIFFSFHALFFFVHTKQHPLTSVITYESQMKKSLQLLPDDFNGYGNGFLEAPQWSFLSGKKFKDVFRDSVFYGCIENDCHNYLFTHRYIFDHNDQLNLIFEVFNLKDIFEFREFRISKIEGFNKQGKTYAEEIDFTKENVKQSIARIHDRTRHKMYSPPHFELNEMGAFLDNNRGFPLIEIELIAHECHDGKNLKAALLSKKEKHIQNFTVKQGENKIEISLPKKFRGSKIDVYLLLEKASKRSESSHCKEQNADRIPLGYKRIQLIDRSIPNIS